MCHVLYPPIFSNLTTFPLSASPPITCPSPLQVSPALWRREWPSPRPWLRDALLTWLSGKTGACRQLAQVVSPSPASPTRRGKKRDGWRMTPTVTSVTARRRLVLLQVGNKHIAKGRCTTEPADNSQPNDALINSVVGISAKIECRHDKGLSTEQDLSFELWPQVFCSSLQSQRQHSWHGHRWMGRVRGRDQIRAVWLTWVRSTRRASPVEVTGLRHERAAAEEAIISGRPRGKANKPRNNV